MSPTSRKRRGKPGRARRPDGDAVLDTVLRDVGRDLTAADRPLDAELAVSALAGSWWDLDLIDADPEVEFGERLVARAASTRSVPALALLRVLAELGTPAQRAAASAGVAALAAAGVADPPWVPGLGAVRPAGTWAYGDVYGDQVSVLLAFERPDEAHGVVVLVDHTLGGIAKDAFVTDDPAGTLSDIRSLADPTVWVRELPAAEAAALLVPAFAATDAGRDLPLGEHLRETRALAVARLRLLPAPPPPARPAPAEDPAALAAEFLAATALPGVDAPARCAQLVADGMAAIDGRPARVSPVKIALLFDDLADTLDPDDDAWAAVPPVVSAWAEWAARRAGLPDAALLELAEAVAEAQAGGGVPDGLLDALLDGVDPMSPEELQEVLARRMFAVAGPALVLDRQELTLDPSDPDDRGLLLRAEHPEYADVLDDPAAGLADDGVNPRLHVAMHEMVAAHLWDGEPAETWPAAQRLLATGMDRHDVLHALAEVATRHVHAALVEHRPYDATAHAADLAALGAPTRPRRGRRR